MWEYEEIRITTGEALAHRRAAVVGMLNSGWTLVAIVPDPHDWKTQYFVYFFTREIQTKE